MKKVFISLLEFQLTLCTRGDEIEHREVVVTAKNTRSF